MYISSRDSKGRLSSKLSQNRAIPCELIDDLIASNSGVSRDSKKPHHI